jgi:hypothetical protein
MLGVCTAFEGCPPLWECLYFSAGLSESLRGGGGNLSGGVSVFSSSTFGPLLLTLAPIDMSSGWRSSTNWSYALGLRAW